MQEDFFHPQQDIAGLLSMGTGTHIEIIVRSWDLEFFKKNVRHLQVVVLPGMDKNFSMVLSNLAGDRGTLNKLGPGTDDRYELHPKSLLYFSNILFTSRYYSFKFYRVFNVVKRSYL
jgi:hypothetical protein